MDDPATLLRLPDSDQRILVAPDPPTTLRPGHSLSSLVTNSRSMFPVVVRVVDWKQQSTVLEHHYVAPGTQLVLHGTAQQTKVGYSSLSMQFFVSIFRGVSWIIQWGSEMEGPKSAATPPHQLGVCGAL